MFSSLTSFPFFEIRNNNIPKIERKSLSVSLLLNNFELFLKANSSANMELLFI